MKTSPNLGFAAVALFAAALLLALAAVAPAQENMWTSHGPTNVGSVNGLAIADAVAYAATPNGIYRSTDAAASWQQSGLAGEAISQVIARSGATVVLARGTLGVLYASRDSGETWARIPDLPAVFSAAIDPWHLSTLYAGASDGTTWTIWRSTDAGASWQQISTSPPGNGALSFEFDSHAIYMVGFDVVDGLLKPYQSLDGGVSWAPITSLVPPVGTIAAGAAPGVVYAGGQGTFCRSADSAATWTCTSFPEAPVHIVELPSNVPGKAPVILTASAGNLYLSADSGATWASADGELGFGLPLFALASDAAGSLALVGTDTTIFRSKDRGKSWTSASAGLQSSSILALALDPHDPSTVWAGSPNAGLFRSADGGFSWSPVEGAGSPLYSDALAIDPEHPSTIYAGGSAVYLSADDGANWTSSAVNGGGYVTDLAVDPLSPQRVWAVSDRLFTSGNFGSWGSPVSLAQSVYCILFDTKRPGTVYAGSYFEWDAGYYGGAAGGSIFVSQDSGTSWTRIGQDVGSPVRAIASDPVHDNVYYVGTDSGVFRTLDGGAVWQPGLGLPPTTASALVVDPARPGRLYTAVGGGVYRTLDGAQTWQPFSSGLGSLPVQKLVISPDGKWLHAGTNGGGVFELDLTSSYPCTPSATRLCLVDRRYAVELLAAPAGVIPYSPGTARALGDRAGYFSLPFATGDPELPEVVVKMLGDGAFGVGGAPVFYSSLTTLPYSVTVTDTVTGQQKVYASDPGKPLCGGTKLPFGNAEASISARSSPAGAGESALRLLGGRFSVTLAAHNPRSGPAATGAVMSSGDQFGIFSLPDITGDPDFPEVVVKMVDFRAITGEFWFFYTGLTGLDYTLTVTDSQTRVVRTYESPGSFCGSADTHAFTD